MAHTVETVQWLDCPAAGPQNVTSEWRVPTHAGNSWTRHPVAAAAMHMDWTTYTRAAAPLGYEDTIDPQIATRVLTCPGCGEIVRVELRGRMVSTPVGTAHKRRAIEIVVGRSKVGRCNGLCLNGKRSCDCRCRGACHGRGQCGCGTPAALVSR